MDFIWFEKIQRNVKKSKTIYFWFFRLVVEKNILRASLTIIVDGYVLLVISMKIIQEKI